MRVIDHKEEKYKFLSPIFIMKEFRGRGYAQQAMQLAEEIHGSSRWELDTILQEKGNCHLYEVDWLFLYSGYHTSIGIILSLFPTLDIGGEIGRRNIA